MIDQKISFSAKTKSLLYSQPGGKVVVNKATGKIIYSPGKQMPANPKQV
jgi:hypothetical protein